MRFDCVSLGFYSILLGLIAFYWVLPSFTGFFEEEILHGLPGFAWVFLGITRFTGFSWVLLGFTGFYWVLSSFIGFYWV